MGQYLESLVVDGKVPYWCYFGERRSVGKPSSRWESAVVVLQTRKWKAATRSNKARRKVIGEATARKRDEAQRTKEEVEEEEEEEEAKKKDSLNSAPMSCVFVTFRPHPVFVHYSHCIFKGLKI
jgi:hypothetical protein